MDFMHRLLIRIKYLIRNKRQEEDSDKFEFFSDVSDDYSHDERLLIHFLQVHSYKSISSRC